MNSLNSQRAFDNYNNYRNLYYAEVYRNMVEFRLKYNLKRGLSVEKLESILGDYFEKTKADSKLSEINKKLILELDQHIYFALNKIQAKYNNYFPISHNPNILSGVQEDLQKALQEFYNKNEMRFNDQSD